MAVAAVGQVLRDRSRVSTSSLARPGSVPSGFLAPEVIIPFGADFEDRSVNRLRLRIVGLVLATTDKVSSSHRRVEAW
jgi:hypothetical protein